MIIAIILAAGKGSRIESADRPKQYLNIDDKPMLVHTAERFLVCEQMDHIVITVHKDWIQYTEGLFKDYGYERITVCEGGDNRQESLYKALVYCKEQLNAPDEAIILSHDAARPFVTQEIIIANIQSIQDSEVVTTVIPAIDTLIQSEDGLTMTAATDRYQMFQVQTPQTFRLKQYLDVYKGLDEVEKLKSTDAAGLLNRHGLTIKLVRGTQKNFKITTDFDLRVAEMLSGGFSV